MPIFLILYSTKYLKNSFGINFVLKGQRNRQIVKGYSLTSRAMLHEPSMHAYLVEITLFKNCMIKDL